MQQEALVINNLSKSYGNFKAVNNISFTVNKGEIMGLLGPNGAGKSTAIRIIMGILSASSGEVKFLFNGDSSVLDKSKIGYLPEERGLYDDVKVLDNLLYLASLKGVPQNEAKEEAMNWLERLNLANYANSKLEKLSKGMQQKVQFIGAILHKPALVVLDEPFSGLDPVNQDVFKEIILELGRQGTTVLLSAHQMNVVEELCDRIFMINKGKQVLFGSLKEIKQGFKEYMVKITYQGDGDVSFLQHKSGVSRLHQGRHSVTFSYEADLGISELLQEITEKVAVEEIRAEKPPLHDIFIQTVQQRGEEIE
ncbi:ABC transporter ATP-binding protein [Dethiobacter alkaliphilus]|uniref:ABC transporter related protein n=1 Tax=Dethiobacter alkaliphilus AHT 1 TaxID=555088 RepID=C0GFH4_DETAL|nr:ATP-binding cassette domain-containing protein [Dethiobacter alkaliphilus]EEG77934.1 ABC transporter related protein [Dethiobacter alkaliphilus AHT 1]